MRFGIGLTPLGIALPLTQRDAEALTVRLREFAAIGIDELVLAFDDDSGERPHLAARQVELAHWVAACAAVPRLHVVPTYYADDPLLDRLFGERPPGYLAELGRRLDSAIGVYWAGEAIVPRRIESAHIERVAHTLRRPPRLWDNYPVNDGPNMAPHLHLRATTGRPAELADHIEAHAINPALQPMLSAIPAITLAEAYGRGAGYDPTMAFRRAADEVLGAELAACVERDLPLLQDVGLNELGERKELLRARYREFDHPAAREIVAWLDGRYAGHAVPTQARD